MQDAAPPPHLAAHVEGVWAAADVLLRRVARLLRRRVGARVLIVQQQCGVCIHGRQPQLHYFAQVGRFVLKHAACAAAAAIAAARLHVLCRHCPQLCQRQRVLGAWPPICGVPPCAAVGRVARVRGAMKQQVGELAAGRKLGLELRAAAPKLHLHRAGWHTMGDAWTGCLLPLATGACSGKGCLALDGPDATATPPRTTMLCSKMMSALAAACGMMLASRQKTMTSMPPSRAGSAAVLASMTRRLATWSAVRRYRIAARWWVLDLGGLHAWQAHLVPSLSTLQPLLLPVTGHSLRAPAKPCSPEPRVGRGREQSVMMAYAVASRCDSAALGSARARSTACARVSSSDL